MWKIFVCPFVRVLSYAAIIAYFGNKYAMSWPDKLLIGAVVLVWMATSMIDARS